MNKEIIKYIKEKLDQTQKEMIDERVDDRNYFYYLGKKEAYKIILSKLGGLKNE